MNDRERDKLNGIYNRAKRATDEKTQKHLREFEKHDKKEIGI